MTTKSRNFINKEQEKEYVEYYKRSVKRMNFNGGYYLNIFNKAVKQYAFHKKETEDLFETGKKTGMITLEWYLEDQKIRPKMKHNELIAITFAAMFLECIIWDYAAVNTSQSLTEDFLSNISLVGKWKVIPKLVNNDKNINIDHKAIALLKKLVKERNNILHSKSKAVPDTYDEIKQIEKKGSAITIPETVECVKRCIEGLQKVDTTNYWFFEKEDRHTVTFKLPNFKTPKYKENRV